MRNAFFRKLAPCACLLLAGAAIPAWAAPVDPFKNYQGWRDVPVQDWRAANDRVGEVGGWRAYLRESQPGGGGHDHGAPQPQPQPQPQPPGDSGRHGHHHHGH